MAACATTYFGEGCGWSSPVAERNRRCFERQLSLRRGSPTPEIYFSKSFDNSRLEQMPDPMRARQMKIFSIASALLFTLVMIYGLQHFSAIESGYSVEAKKQLRNELREENRQLHLADAQLAQPDRIDALAHGLGLDEPAPGQVAHPEARQSSDAPVYAKADSPVLPAR